MVASYPGVSWAAHILLLAIYIIIFCVFLREGVSVLP